MIADRRILDDLAARLVPDRSGPTWDAASAYAPINSDRQLRRIDGTWTSAPPC